MDNISYSEKMTENLETTNESSENDGKMRYSDVCAGKRRYSDVCAGKSREEAEICGGESIVYTPWRGHQGSDIAVSVSVSPVSSRHKTESCLSYLPGNLSSRPASTESALTGSDEFIYYSDEDNEDTLLVEDKVDHVLKNAGDAPGGLAPLLVDHQHQPVDGNVIAEDTGQLHARLKDKISRINAQFCENGIAASDTNFPPPVFLDKIGALNMPARIRKAVLDVNAEFDAELQNEQGNILIEDEDSLYLVGKSKLVDSSTTCEVNRNDDGMTEDARTVGSEETDLAYLSAQEDCLSPDSSMENQFLSADECGDGVRCEHSAADGCRRHGLGYCDLSVCVPGFHKLQYEYSFWYSVKAKRYETDYNKNLHFVASFDTVEAFWSYYSHIMRPDTFHQNSGKKGYLPPHKRVSDLAVFKSNIKPVWEHPANSRGGKWMVRLKKGSSSLPWENLLLAMLGEQFQHVSQELCGAVISMRPKEDILSLWNRSAEDLAVTTSIRDMFRDVLNLGTATAILEYKTHGDSLKDNTSFRNTDIYVH